MPEEELYDRDETIEEIDRPGILESVKLCFTNRYFISLLLSYLFYYIMNGFNGISIYYFTYIMKNVDQYSTYSSIYYFPMLIGLLFTPYLIKKTGMFKAKLYGYALAIVSRIFFIVAGYIGNFTFMLVALFLFGYAALLYAGAGHYGLGSVLLPFSPQTGRKYSLYLLIYSSHIYIFSISFLKRCCTSRHLFFE